MENLKRNIWRSWKRIREGGKQFLWRRNLKRGIMSSLQTVDLVLSILLFIFIFLLFCFIFIFSIFRTTRVRVDRSRCHISHNLMA